MDPDRRRPRWAPARRSGASRPSTARTAPGAPAPAPIARARSCSSTSRSSTCGSRAGARRAGVPVVYFIPPQLWAWRARPRPPDGPAGEARARGLPVRAAALRARPACRWTFVGHPLLDVLPLDLDADEARRRLGVDPGHALVGLLPGSRREEVERLLPVDARRGPAPRRRRRRGAASCSAWRRPWTREQVATLLSAAGPGEPAGRAGERAHLRGDGARPTRSSSPPAPRPSRRRCSARRWSSATASRGSPRLIARALTRVPWIGLPNLVSGRAVVPELLQGEVTGARLAAGSRAPPRRPGGGHRPAGGVQGSAGAPRRAGRRRAAPRAPCSTRRGPDEDPGVRSRSPPAPSSARSPCACSRAPCACGARRRRWRRSGPRARP